MSEYGRDESAPTPGGVFRGYFVGECWVFTECFVVISWVFVALLTIRSHRIGRLLAAVGDRFIVPVYTCSPRVRYLCVTYSPCKSMVFALQKYGFWRAKTTFLAYKNHLFDLQKVGFCIFVKYISIFIDINKEYERTYNKFIKMV